MASSVRVRTRGKIRIDTKRLADELAEDAIKAIREEVASGRDADGRIMRPYKDTTAERRKRDGKTSSRVTLRRTGRMLEGLRARARQERGGRVEITISPPADREAAAGSIEAGGRKWLGLSKAAMKRIRQAIERTRVFASR